MGIVDHRHHGVLVLEVAPQLKNAGTDSNGLAIGRRLTRRGNACGIKVGEPGQLVDHTIGNKRLPLFAADPEHPCLRLRSQEPVNQGGLTDATSAFDDHHSRVPVRAWVSAVRKAAISTARPTNTSSLVVIVTPLHNTAHKGTSFDAQCCTASAPLPSPGVAHLLAGDLREPAARAGVQKLDEHRRTQHL